MAWLFIFFLDKIITINRRREFQKILIAHYTNAYTILLMPNLTNTK